jgi:O-acetyl-ADP-ribose deacetylase (regulator of RNase III)
MDIWKSNAEAIVIPTNCVGTMGAGLAKQCRFRFKKETDTYFALCRASFFSPGDIHLTHIDEPPHNFAGEKTLKYLILFMTKDNWKQPSKLEWIKRGLVNMLRDYELNSYQSVAIPALGCGYGQLNWYQVKPLIEAFALLAPCHVNIYAPQKSPS